MKRICGFAVVALIGFASAGLQAQAGQLEDDLYNAASNGDLAKVQSLVSQGADVNGQKACSA